jgi:ABC-type amino acid transport system permease subunit
MFDNFRERIRKLEETNETFRSAKQHVERHQMAYACGATGIVCVGGTRFFTARPVVIHNHIEPMIAPTFNNVIGHSVPS